MNVAENLFQFQTGAIKRERLDSMMSIIQCFNSKLVRLKECFCGIINIVNRVSIPNWCD